MMIKYVIKQFKDINLELYELIQPYDTLQITIDGTKYNIHINGKYGKYCYYPDTNDHICFGLFTSNTLYIRLYFHDNSSDTIMVKYKTHGIETTKYYTLNDNKLIEHHSSE